MQAPIDNLTFEEWWAELAEAVRAWLLRRRVPPHLVDDIVQETGLRLFKMWDEIDAMRSPRGLAFTIASNLLWDERNRRASREVVGEVPELSREDVERAGMARLELARVKRAMSRLNAQQRAVLLAEIGDATGPSASPDAVKMMRMRARRRLTALLDSAPAGAIVLIRMPRKWLKGLRSANRSAAMQVPALALVAVCTTIAVVGVPANQPNIGRRMGVATARNQPAETAAWAAARADRPAVQGQSPSRRVAASTTHHSSSQPPTQHVRVDVPEGAPVGGHADVLIEDAETFDVQPPQCSAKPSGGEAHVQCEAQVGDYRAELDSVVGIDP